MGDGFSFVYGPSSMVHRLSSSLTEHRLFRDLCQVREWHGEICLLSHGGVRYIGAFIQKEKTWAIRLALRWWDAGKLPRRT